MDHTHCDNCFNNLCNVSDCPVIHCKLDCGACYHQCKQTEHLLLCSKHQVPCLNSTYGCPAVLPRHQLARHLTVCPASVVQCPAVWRRYMVTETSDIPNITLVGAKLNPDYLAHCLVARDLKILKSRNLSRDELLETKQRRVVRKKSTVISCEGMGDFIPGFGFASLRNTTLFTDADNESEDELEEESGSKYLGITCNLEPVGGQITSHPAQQFNCNSDFRRDEFLQHYEFIHADIYSSLNGIMESFCPMHLLGCDFSSRNRDGKNCSVTYDHTHESFSTKTKGCEIVKSPDYEISLQDLPALLLYTIFKFLDPLSLSNLSLTCHHLRDVTEMFLEERGMVIPVWVKIDKNNYKIDKYVWKFSAFSGSISEWSFQSDRMLKHIANCPYKKEMAYRAPEKFAYTLSLDEIHARSRCSQYSK